MKTELLAVHKNHKILTIDPYNNPKQDGIPPSHLSQDTQRFQAKFQGEKPATRSFAGTNDEVITWIYEGSAKLWLG